MAKMDSSRREFLGSIASIAALPGYTAQSEADTSFPSPPMIPGEPGNGWSAVNETTWEEGELRASLRYYSNQELRNQVKAETSGDVDQVISGFLALKVGEAPGNDIVGEEDVVFESPRTAWLDHRSTLQDRAETYLDSFGPDGLETSLGVNRGWIQSLGDILGALPAGLGAAQNAADAGPAELTVTNTGDSVSLTRYEAEYPLGMESRIDYFWDEKEPISADYVGWFGSWAGRKYLYAVVGAHPDIHSQLLSDRTNFEEDLTQVSDSDINLDLDYSLPDQMHNLMGRIQ